MVTTIDNMQEYDIDYILDLSGLFCPEPLMLVHKQVKAMSSGEVLKITATDPATCRDIPNFCHFLKHTLLFKTQDKDRFIYHIRTG